MSPIELGVICFVAFMLVMLLVVRAKRSHDQKIRRAASSGFYDFDVAHYGTEGGSLMEKAVDESRRPLAPSFAASGRGAEKSGKRSGPGRPPPSTPMPAANPMPVPTSFGVIDRSPAGPLPTFERNTGPRQMPLPSSAKVPPPPRSAPPAPDAPLPLLEQPPPPPPSDPPS
jgi:hypothetical protein